MGQRQRQIAAYSIGSMGTVTLPIVKQTQTLPPSLPSPSYSRLQQYIYYGHSHPPPHPIPYGFPPSFAFLFLLRGTFSAPRHFLLLFYLSTNVPGLSATPLHLSPPPFLAAAIHSAVSITKANGKTPVVPSAARNARRPPVRRLDRRQSFAGLPGPGLFPPQIVPKITRVGSRRFWGGHPSAFTLGLS